jgi:hypothetical protein
MGDIMSNIIYAFYHKNGTVIRIGQGYGDTGAIVLGYVKLKDSKLLRKLYINVKTYT